MKKLLITASFALLGAIVLAQDRTTSSGGDATGSGGTVSYTIGLIDYSNASGSNGNIHEGVQQPLEFYTVNVDEWILDYSLSVFPNPASDFLIISSEQQPEGLNFVLTDAAGKIVREDAITELETTIDLSNLAPAGYFLTIQSENQFVQTYKLIKH